MANGISVRQTGRKDQKTPRKWRAQVRRGNDRRFTKSFATKEEATLAGAMLLVEMGAELPPEDVSPRIDELLIKHLYEKDYAPTTAEDLRRIIRLLPSSVSVLKVGEQTPRSITQVYKDLAKLKKKSGERKWSDHRIRRFHEFLSSAYGTAIWYGWAETNPCRDARVPKKPVPKQRDISLEDVYAVIERSAKTNKALPTFLRLALNSGARRSELVALRWENVGKDFIWIAESHTEAQGAVHVGNTKTGRLGWRKVGLPKALMAELETLRDEGPYVFSHDHGHTAWRPSYVTRAVGRLTKGTNVGLHALRHFQASHLLSNGVPVHEVSARLGHANVSTTLNIYAHAMPARDVENAERFAL